MISKECFVYIQLHDSHELVTLGRLVWEKAGSFSVGRFIYGKTYLENPNAIALDPFNIPLGNRTFECTINDGIVGPIRDASPDLWGRFVIEKNTPREEWDEIGYLLNSAEDRVGALAFGLGAKPPAPKRTFNKTMQLERLIQAAHKLERDDPVDDSERRLLMGGASMGGARPKTTVERDHELWLAKFPSYKDKNNYAKIEFGTMRLARDCGLRIPEIDLVKIGAADVFLIKRFDREWDQKNSGYLRCHFVSGLTALNLDEQDRRNWSYIDLAEQMRRWIRNPKEDLEELFRRIVFSALVSNEDDHPRNHGLLHLSKGYRLSPAYDLVPKPGTGTSRYSAMVLGTEGRVFTRKNILSKSDAFGLSRETAEAIFEKMKTVGTNWRRYYAEANLSADDFKFLEPAFNWEGLSF